MPENMMRCPKCDAEMIQGYISDYGHGQIRQSRWAAGLPKKGWFPGNTKRPSEETAIGTFRCVACGYLESYARPEFEAK